MGNILGELQVSSPSPLPDDSFQYSDWFYKLVAPPSAIWWYSFRRAVVYYERKAVIVAHLGRRVERLAARSLSRKLNLEMHHIAYAGYSMDGLFAESFGAECGGIARETLEMVLCPDYWWPYLRWSKTSLPNIPRSSGLSGYLSTWGDCMALRRWLPTTLIREIICAKRWSTSLIQEWIKKSNSAVYIWQLSFYNTTKNSSQKCILAIPK